MRDYHSGPQKYSRSGPWKDTKPNYQKGFHSSRQDVHLGSRTWVLGGALTRVIGRFFIQVLGGVLPHVFLLNGFSIGFLGGILLVFLKRFSPRSLEKIFTCGFPEQLCNWVRGLIFNWGLGRMLTRLLGRIFIIGASRKDFYNRVLGRVLTWICGRMLTRIIF